MAEVANKVKSSMESLTEEMLDTFKAVPDELTEEL